MLISQEVTNYSAFFRLERTGDEVTATYSYGLTGYYNEELGYYEWNGELLANIGEDGGAHYQTSDRPMDVWFVATLVAGVIETGSYTVNDYIGGAQFTHDYTVTVFSTAAVFGDSGVADYVFGSDFSDSIAGGLGDDNIEGAGGNDTLQGGDGSDALAGGAGLDQLSGGAGNDRLTGALGVDIIDGGLDDDFVAGQGGADLLTGGGGVDSINGGYGADTIDGGGDGDRLIGGAGRDRFYYDFTADSLNTAFEHDVIGDFTLAQDVVDLHDIDAKVGEAGNQDFTFIGTAAFTAEGQVRFHRAGNQGYVLVNTEGVDGAEMAIRLPGILAISEASFIL